MMQIFKRIKAALSILIFGSKSKAARDLIGPRPDDR